MCIKQTACSGGGYESDMLGVVKQISCLLVKMMKQINQRNVIRNRIDFQTRKKANTNEAKFALFPFPVTLLQHFIKAAL